MVLATATTVGGFEEGEFVTPEMAARLRAKIMMMLGDEDYLGGPLQRPYPKAIQKGIADGVLVEVEEMMLEAQGSGPAIA